MYIFSYASKSLFSLGFKHSLITTINGNGFGGEQMIYKHLRLKLVRHLKKTHTKKTNNKKQSPWSSVASRVFPHFIPWGSQEI